MDYGDSSQNISFSNSIRSAEYPYDDERDQQDLETVHVGDILSKLSKLHEGVEALRTGIAAIPSDSFCSDSDYGTESKLSILSEILSADLLGRADEIRGMLAEVQKEYKTKTFESGERLAYEKIEREINRIYPDLERTVHLVRVTERNRMARASRRQSKQDQVTEANIRTQNNDGISSPKVISLKIAKTTDDTTHKTGTDSFYRHVLNTTEKSIVTNENAVTTVATLLEEDLAKGGSHAICTRKRLTRTRESKGQLPVKEILMNVRVTQKTNEQTGEIQETFTDLETESEFDQCYVIYHTGQTPQTLYMLDPSKRFPSGYNSTSQTSLYESASERNAVSQRLDPSLKSDNQSDHQNQPVRLEKKIAPYFEVIAELTEQELKESEKRCLWNLEKARQAKAKANYADPSKEPIISASVGKNQDTVNDADMKSASKELLDALREESTKTDSSLQTVQKNISSGSADKSQGFDSTASKKVYPVDINPGDINPGDIDEKKNFAQDDQFDSEFDIKSFLKKELNIETSDNDQRITSGYEKRGLGPDSTHPKVITIAGKVTLPMLRTSVTKSKFPRKSKSKELYKERRYLNISVVEVPDELEVIPEEPQIIPEKLNDMQEECPLACHYNVKTSILDLTESDIEVLFSERAKRQKMKNGK